MACNARVKLDFLVLGHSPEGAFPVTISVHPRGRTTLLNFSVGSHPLSVGEQLAVTQVILDGALNETFGNDFDACEARWLVPHLERIAAGENFTADDLIGAYQSKFGHPPKVEQSADYTS